MLFQIHRCNFCINLSNKWLELSALLHRPNQANPIFYKTRLDPLCTENFNDIVALNYSRSYLEEAYITAIDFRLLWSHMKLPFFISLSLLAFSLLLQQGFSEQTKKSDNEKRSMARDIIAETESTANANKKALTLDNSSSKCERSFCGFHHGPCCPGLFCVSNAFCKPCQRSFCGLHHAPCCSGLFCVSNAFCKPCSRSFCGIHNAPCCSGLSCVHGFCR